MEEEDNKFDQWLDNTITEKYGDWYTLEQSRSVQDGSVSMAGTGVKDMVKAVYGRVTSGFVREILRDIVKIQPTDEFVDIGSGIGTICLQAWDMGVRESVIGIEVMSGRYELGLSLLKSYAKTVDKTAADNIRFFRRDFRDKAMIAMIKDATVFFVNNAEGIFSDRASNGDAPTLDYSIAELACGMSLGSRMVVFSPLTDLQSSIHYQCFDVTVHESSMTGATSWASGAKRTKIIMYTKKSHQWICENCRHKNKLVLGEMSCTGCNRKYRPTRLPFSSG
jgi:hypothetical protein